MNGWMQSAKISSLMADKQELQAQVSGLTTEHDEKMNELLDTLHAVRGQEADRGQAGRPGEGAG